MPIQPLTNDNKLKPGRFYRSRNGSTWCCYRVDLDRPAHSQAICVRVTGDRAHDVAWFGLDGSAGTGDWTLVEELIEEQELGPAPKESEIILMCSKFIELLMARRDNGGIALEEMTVLAARELRDALSRKLGG